MALPAARELPARRLAGAGAVALLAFMLLLDWLGVSFRAGSRSTGALSALPSALEHSSTGWQAFTWARWVWLLTILLALVLALSARAWQELRGIVDPGALLAGLGALSSLLIFYRVVHHPIAHTAGLHASAQLKIGIWLGLIARAAIAYGGYLQIDAAAAGQGADGPQGAEQAFGGLTVTGAEQPAEDEPPAA
jgi:hypothetical protein